MAQVIPVVTESKLSEDKAHLEISWTSTFGQQFDLLKSTDLLNWDLLQQGIPASATDTTTSLIQRSPELEREFYSVELKDERIPKPNVILLFADDLGYGDLACYGHPYAKTPNLDRLATQGTLFKKFNVTGTTCNPSRTGILTSRHPESFPRNTADFGFNQEEHGDEKDRITIMELLKTQGGYVTAQMGKWHIGPVQESGVYGIDLVQGGGGDNSTPRGRDESLYANAIAFIENHVENNEGIPFYLNVMGRVTHNPVAPREDVIESAGFANLQVDRDDFEGDQIQIMFDAVEAASAGDQDINTSMASYLTEIYFLDEFIGELLSKLDELGIAENTIVMFSSDQGPAVVKDQSNKPEKTNVIGYSGGLRGQKHDEHEGGIRVPCIMRWPGYIPAGKINTESTFSALDWLPTLCRIAGVTIDLEDFHGEDVLDIWMGADRSRLQPQFWAKSMKMGEWRLYFRRSNNPQPIELYDLSTDLFETNNLIDSPEHEELINEMQAIWFDWKDNWKLDGSVDS
ncbi:MAG: sulfatase-like hydrolase/transferase [Verrucomicrobiota bacterium]